MLQLINIEKKYKRTVLKNVSYNFKKSKIYAILGVNGSGKSTLMSILSGNTKPKKGFVKVDNQNIYENNNFKKIGYVPQQDSLFLDLKVKDNINFWATIYKKNFKSEYFNNHLLNTKVKNLSGGNKKLLSIETCLMNNQDYILLDEPTSALDFSNQIKIIDLIKKFKSENKCVIFTTHNENEIKICDEILIIHNNNLQKFDSTINIENFYQIKN